MPLDQDKSVRQARAAQQMYSKKKIILSDFLSDCLVTGVNMQIYMLVRTYIVRMHVHKL